MTKGRIAIREEAGYWGEGALAVKGRPAVKAERGVEVSPAD